MAGEAQGTEIGGRASLRVSALSGRISVVAENRDGVLVERGHATPDPDDPNRLRVDGGTDRVEVRVPFGTDVVVGASSGRVELRGRFGAVSVTAISQRVEIEEAERVDVRVGSGRVEIGRCDGLCRIKADSGRTEIGSAGGADVSVVSGAIRIDDVRGPARLKTVSGRIEVGLGGAFDVDAESVSGRIQVLVPPDVHPEVVLRSRGRTECGIVTGADSTIRARSVSGRLEVRSATGRRR